MSLGARLGFPVSSSNIDLYAGFIHSNTLFQASSTVPHLPPQMHIAFTLCNTAFLRRHSNNASVFIIPNRASHPHRSNSVIAKMTLPPIDGTPRKPEECNTMSHVRKEIDDLDQQLVQLLGKRFGYIHRASELKKDLVDTPALIPWRVEQVVDRVRNHAVKERLSPDLIERVWRLLMAWFIDYEAAQLLETAPVDAHGSSEDRI